MKYRLIQFGTILSLLLLYSQAGSFQYYPFVTYNPDTNGYLVIYTTDKGEGEIFGQMLDSDAKMLGNDFTVFSAHPYSRFQSAYDSDNHKFLVVWSGLSGSHETIYGQYVLSQGGLAATPHFIIREFTNYNGSYPVVAYGQAEHRFLSAWIDGYNSLGNVNHIYGQFIEASLSYIIYDNFNITPTNYPRFYPAIAYDNKNCQFLIAWQEERESTFKIYGQLVHENGSLMGSNFSISSSSYETSMAALAYDPTYQRFLVVWDDYRNRSPVSSDIYGRFISSTGAKVGSSDFQIASADSHQELPAIAFNELTQQYMVVWGDRRNSPNNEIYGRLIGRDGSLGSEIPIFLGTFSNYPKIAANSKCGNFLISYQNGAAIHNMRYGDFQPRLDLSPATQDFGQVLAGDTATQQFTVENIGCASLIVSAISQQNPVEEAFSLTAENCINTLARANEPFSCTFSIAFTPDQAGPFQVTYLLAGNDPRSPIELTLSGTGFIPDSDTGPDGGGTDTDAADAGADISDEVDSGSTNTAPTQPILVSPENGAEAVPTTYEFRFKRSQDADGDQIIYNLYICPREDFSECNPYELYDPQTGFQSSLRSNSPINYGLGASGLIFFGLLLFGAFRSRKKTGPKSLLLFFIIIGLSMAEGACEKSTREYPAKPTDEMSQTVSAMDPNTNYFWKVIAKDGKGGETPSETWKFKTGASP